jgi:hypothetical protein
MRSSIAARGSIPTFVAVIGAAIALVGSLRTDIGLAPAREAP